MTYERDEDRGDGAPRDGSPARGREPRHDADLHAEAGDGRRVGERNGGDGGPARGERGARGVQRGLRVVRADEEFACDDVREAPDLGARDAEEEDEGHECPGDDDVGVELGNAEAAEDPDEEAVEGGEHGEQGEDVCAARTGASAAKRTAGDAAYSTEPATRRPCHAPSHKLSSISCAGGSRRLLRWACVLARERVGGAAASVSGNATLAFTSAAGMAMAACARRVRAGTPSAMYEPMRRAEPLDIAAGG